MNDPTRSQDSGVPPRGGRNEKTTRATELPPMSRALQRFALIACFAGGVALTAFALTNPLGLPFLPRPAGDRAAPAAPVAASAEAIYQCPMHPEVLQHEPGDCPICHMKLVRVDTPTPPPAEAIYQCPMHPEVLQHEPGDCPICHMKLVRVDTDRPPGEDGTARSDVVRIDPVQIQNTGIARAPARRGSIARTARTVGILDFNADRITWINTKFSGWVEKVHVNYVGQEVRKDDPLFEIYSPELVTTQEEYLRALDYHASLEGSEHDEAVRQAASLLRSTRDRLAYWDIGADQIESLASLGEVRRRLTVRSSVDGVVAGVMNEALEGMFVQPGMNLYKIADLSSLWVHAEIYESDMPWVREGQPATVTFRFDPKRVVRGKVLFLYPELSRETRTLKICVEVPNAQGHLRAGMYADVVIEGPQLRDVVLIPDAAVLRTGLRDLVFVEIGEGRYQPREVELGVRGEGNVVQVLGGVAPGESVVTQGQFMIDSESRTQEAIAKFRERGTAETREAADHGGHR